MRKLEPISVIASAIEEHPNITARGSNEVFSKSSMVFDSVGRLRNSAISATRNMIADKMAADDINVLVIIFSRTSKSAKPYQQERASNAGLRLELRWSMRIGRLIRVAVSRLVLLILLLSSENL